MRESGTAFLKCFCRSTAQHQRDGTNSSGEGSGTLGEEGQQKNKTKKNKLNGRTQCETLMCEPVRTKMKKKNCVYIKKKAQTHLQMRQAGRHSRHSPE